jgi:response regulator RpfG family c-di-GMP phosphodiesterase
MDRVYKKAWDIDQIVEFFKEEQGQHFDPVLIEIFLENVHEFIMIKETYNLD